MKTRSLPVHIKHGCWIGGGVIILPGVTIGEGTVIGAGSVVTKDIPDRVAVGNPCHVYEKLTNKATLKTAPSCYYLRAVFIMHN